MNEAKLRSHLQQEHSEYTDLRQGNSSLDSESGSGADDFQNLNRTGLCCTSTAKFSRRSNQFFRRYETNCGKMPSFAMHENSPGNSQIQMY